MKPLLKNPSLSDFQNYVAEMVKERGFDKESILEIFLLFSEECGELAKEIRKSTNIHIDKNSKTSDLSDELADIFIYLLDICNYFDLDLEQAFRQKEEKNRKRIWAKTK